MIHHSGSTFGYRAFLTLLPDMNVGVVSLMTGSDYQYKFRTSLHMYLMDQALGHSPWINATTICSFPNPWRPSRSLRPSRSRRPRRSAWSHPLLDDQEEGEELFDEEDEEAQLMEQPRASRVARAASLPLRRYVGRYRHAAYGALEVTYNGDSGSLELVFGIGRWRLESDGGHDFDGQWLGAPPTINKSFRFKATGSRVYAVQGVGFEPAKPPVFYR